MLDFARLGRQVGRWGRKGICYVGRPTRLGRKEGSLVYR